MGEDLRVIKTKRAIREAFLKLRASYPLERMSVRDICNAALVNKSTFYHHYTDVFDLSDKLENETLASCFEGFPYHGSLFEDPQAFLENMPAAIDAQRDVIGILFSGRKDVMFNKICRMLRAFYLTPETSPEQDVLITFVIGGSMHAMETLADEGGLDRNLVTGESARIIEKLAC